MPLIGPRTAALALVASGLGLQTSRSRDGASLASDLTAELDTVPRRALAGPDGTVAYEDRGEVPLIVLAPGLGDLRQSCRFLAPRLADAGPAVWSATRSPPARPCWPPSSGRTRSPDWPSLAPSCVTTRRRRGNAGRSAPAARALEGAGLDGLPRHAVPVREAHRLRRLPPSAARQLGRARSLRRGPGDGEPQRRRRPRLRRPRRRGTLDRRMFQRGGCRARRSRSLPARGGSRGDGPR